MTSPTIKPDPEVQEEHDELLMSYLNADCLSGDSWPLSNDEQHQQQHQQPLSPPYSTSSDGSINNAEDAYTNKSEDMFAAPTANMMDYTSWLAAAAAAGLPQANNLNGAASSTYWPAPPPPEFLQSFVPPLYIQQAAAINQSPNIPLLQPSIQPQPQQQDVKLSSASSTASCSSSDSEQPRKKRGRKKKDPIGIASAPSTQLRPLARLLPASAQPPQQPNNNNNTSSSSTTATPSPPPQQSSTSPSPSPPSPPVAAAKEQQQQQQPIIPTTVAQQQQQQQQLPLTSNDNTPIPASVKIEPSHSSPEEAQKAAAIAKRQERLIKNRAAALLSRKRKREHLNALEEEKQNLSKENEQLKARVAELESRVDTLEKENHDLRRRMVGNNNTTTTALLSSNKNTSHNKATGVVFMIILFSFALFSLPSRSVNQLTVGGSSPKQLVGGSSSLDLTFFNGGAPTTPRPTLDSGPSSSSSSITPSTDLVLIDPVRPYALRNWIQDRLTTTTTTTTNGGNNVKNHEKSLVQWSSDAIHNNNKAATTRPHIYLYSREFSQVAPIMNDSSTTAACEDNGSSSTFLMNEDNHNNAALLSLISPLPADKNTSYLQIDVQVLGSRVIDGPLMSLEQCPFATSLLDNMKDDLLCTRPTLSTDDNPISTTTTTTAKDNTTTDGAQAALKLPTGRRLNKDMRRRLVGQERARKIARVAD